MQDPTMAALRARRRATPGRRGACGTARAGQAWPRVGRARFHSVLALALAAALAPIAGAQAQAYPNDEVSAQRFHPAPGPSNYLSVEGVTLAPELTPSFGAVLDYAHRPFVAVGLDCYTSDGASSSCEGPRQETALSAHLGALHLLGAVTVLGRLQIGLDLPVLLYDGERYQYVDRVEVAPRTAAVGGTGATLGDPRLSLKVRVLGPAPGSDGFALGASAWVSAPLAHAIVPGHFAGEPLPTGGGNVLAELRVGDFRGALNLGVTARADAQFLESAVGTELTYGLGLAYRFHPAVEGLVDVSGATSFGTRFDSEAPLEARGAVAVHFGELALLAGGGAGLVYGVGVPVARAFLGVSFVPMPARDSDGDGLVDGRDACPEAAEDADDFVDDDGCPDLDNDEDQIPDAQDRCANEAEDVDQTQDDDGCPDLDDDGDGVVDGYDSCPNRPEDRDGDRDADGCPDDDADEDGIPDGADACRDADEDFDGLSDQDGCPEEDADADGVPDERDACPEEAGAERYSGCTRPPRRGG
jgi:hypothetical protein